MKSEYLALSGGNNQNINASRTPLEATPGLLFPADAVAAAVAYFVLQWRAVDEVAYAAERRTRDIILAMYLLSGVLGGLGWIWLSPQPHALCVGASGAIYGVLAAFATLYPRRRLTLLVFFIFPVTLMAWQLVAGLALVEFMLAGRDQASGIAHTAHLAGAFAGFLYIDQLFESTHLRRLWGRLRDYVAQRPAAPRAAPPPPDQAEVDRILDKISAQGIQSLTRAERQTLHRASRTF